MLKEKSGMAEITTRFEVSFRNGKAVAIPEHLLAEHEGKQYLKLRPTSPAICKLLSPSAPSKNPSFSSSPALADLLKKRNEAALVEDKEQSDEEKQSIWSVAAKEAAPVSKKRKRTASTEEPYTVQIDCDGTKITCLLSGQRPARSDLAVCLDSAQLTAVFNKLQPDLAVCFSGSKRSYSKKPS